MEGSACIPFYHGYEGIIVPLCFVVICFVLGVYSSVGAAVAKELRGDSKEPLPPGVV
jgi:hypothetical protein